MEEVAAGACPASMKMATQVEVLSITSDLFGPPMTIHPVLIWDEAGATLVDAGFPGQFEQLKASVEQAGVAFSRLRRLIVTHQDWDHIGTIPQIKSALGGAIEICAHGDEKPYLEGQLSYIKMTPERAASRLAALSERLRPEAAKALAAIPIFSVDRLLADGETLPWHGGIQIIHTPGHTPGHICLLLPAHRLLIAGDQLRIEDGRLVGPAAEHTPDMQAARHSLQKLLDLPADRIACYHGGVYSSGIPARLAELAAGR